MLFDQIEDAIVDEQVLTGLIIHENRFTYAAKGLVKLRDLGEYWEESTGLPIPLGGIVVNRKLPLEVQQKIERVIARSVEYAFANPTSSQPYVKEYAQAMDPAVMQAHIDLYVNHFSIDLGEEGTNAVQYLMQKGRDLNILPPGREDILVAS